MLAPDLPGFGRDRTPAERISLRLWREFVGDLLEAQPEPVVLVGHSRGGIVISEAAEHQPDRIRMLVYLTAFLPRDGESLFDLTAHAGGSEVLPNLIAAADGLTSTVRDEAIRSAFLGECADDDVALVRSLIQPEPVLPSSTPVHLTAANHGRVPRVYIECLRDKAIPPSLQRRMYTASTCKEVLSIDTDHSPFFSRPDELVAHVSML